MYRILPVNEFADRKKLLVAQSSLERQMLLSQVAEAERALAHLKRRLAVFGFSAGAIGVGASAAKLFFGKNGLEGRFGGLFSKMFAGVSVFRQIKSLFDGIRARMGDGEER